MTAWTQLFDQLTGQPEALRNAPLVHALGWTLLHFCWQGAAVALLLWCALSLLSGRSPQARYAATWCALGLMVALPVATFARIATEEFRLRAAMQQPFFGLDVDAGRIVEVGMNAPAAPWWMRCALALNEALPWVLLAWAAGVVVCVIRLNIGFIVARRIRSLGTQAAPPELLATFEALRRRLGVRRAVQLVNSALVQVPTVIGWLRPVVLVPVSCLTGLTAEQIEAILCHELAHIRRHDYLVSVAQSVVEAVLFYHPAVWWVSKQVRREREYCCDDIAVRMGGNRLAYARALSSLEEYRATLPVMVLGANGGVLTMRIRRLLGLKESSVASQVAAATVLTLLAAASGAYVATVARAERRAATPVTATVEAAGDLASAETAAAVASSSAVQAPSVNVEAAPASMARMYRNWLDQDVLWIITPEERTAFLQLTSDAERDRFITQFWEQRNSASANFRIDHYTRIAYTNEHFTAGETPGWRTDRGHIYILNGKPESIDSHPNGAADDGSPYEVWHYLSAKGLGQNVDLKFVDTCRCGDYRLLAQSNVLGDLTRRRPAPETIAVHAAAVRSASLALPALATQVDAQQQATGTIAGVVFDQTGAVIARATVGVIRDDRSRSLTVTTDNDGRFTTPPLPVGSYSVQADVRGFRRAMQSNVQVTSGAQVDLNLRLTVGAVSENLNVTSAASTEPRPQSSDSSPIRVSSGVMAGNLISRPDPVYPPIAKSAHVQGAVVLHAIVTRDGTVRNLNVISGPPMLTASAIDAVRQWVYKPYLLNGEPREVETTVTVNFNFGVDGAPPPPPAPGASQTAPGVVRVSAGVIAGNLISRVDPVYPADAKAAGIQGAVVLRAMIGKSGAVEDLVVASGPKELVESAIDAVKQWTYKPYLLNGEPVAVETTITVNYQLAGGQGAASPEAATPKHIGDGVSAPVLLYSVLPEYSEAARVAKSYGNVLVHLWVDEQGNPLHVQVVRGIDRKNIVVDDAHPPVSQAVVDELNQKAVDAVQRYKFKPAMEDGKPVLVELNVETNFRVF